MQQVRRYTILTNEGINLGYLYRVWNDIKTNSGIAQVFSVPDGPQPFKPEYVKHVGEFRLNNIPEEFKKQPTVLFSTYYDFDGLLGFVLEQTKMRDVEPH
ncbi:MAG: hypothetical protein AB7I96_10555 [Candidatus Dadabacteria bacterium]